MIIKAGKFASLLPETKMIMLEILAERSAKRKAKYWKVSNNNPQN